MKPRASRLASADASSRRGGSVAATSAKPPCIYSSLRHGAWAKKKRLQHAAQHPAAFEIQVSTKYT
jgi:hypothetical protein